MKDLKEFIKGQVWPQDSGGIEHELDVKKAEGFTHVALGEGRYVKTWQKGDEDVFEAYNPLNVKIVNLLTFFGPKKRIQTSEFPKIHESGEGCGMHLKKFKRNYNPREFARHRKHYQIKMGEKILLN